MVDEWRWADPKGQQRLLRTDDLRKALAQGTIAPNVPVWRKGWTGWKPANEVPELMESALAVENGTSAGKVAPPPSFVVAAQTELESVAEQDGPDEPPPPPKYVPAPIVKKAPEASSAKPPPVAPAASAKPPPVATGKPPPVPAASARPPPVAPAASAKPPPAATSPLATSAKPPPLPAKKESVRPEAIDAGWGDDAKKSEHPPAVTVPTMIGVPAIPSELRSPPVRATLPVSPAPP